MLVVGVFINGLLGLPPTVVRSAPPREWLLEVAVPLDFSRFRFLRLLAVDSLVRGPLETLF